MASTDAKPIPQKNVAYRVTFPIYDADGDLVTGATGLDSEISKDGGTFTDCTNEATEIATSSGIYYLDLTSTEMNADTVAVIVKTSSSGAKTTPIIMYPEEAGDIRVNVTQFGGTNGTFASGRPEVNTTHAAGTAWNSGAIGAATLATDTITAAKIAANAITSSEFADGTITAAKFATGAITATVIAADAIGASELAADAVTEIANGVWAANPNLVRTATAQAGTANTITLDASASATDGIYDPSLIIITSGTGAGQARLITSYNGTTKVAVVNRDWRINPDNTSAFRIVAAPNLQSLNEGLAQGGATSSITLNSSASATNDVYNGQMVWITTGTGQDQCRLISAYNGTTKVATVSEAWTTQPNSASGYMILPNGKAQVTSVIPDAITASSIASDATTEIATGVWANSTRTLTALDEDGTSIDIDAAVRGAVGLGAANLDTQLSAIGTDVDDVKAKTDGLTFTVPGQVDSNIQYVNDVQVDGVGSDVDPWGPV